MTASAILVRISRLNADLIADRDVLPWQQFVDGGALEIVLSTRDGRRGSLRIGSPLLEDPDVDAAFDQIRTMILEVADSLVDLPAEAVDARER